MKSNRIITGSYKNLLSLRAKNIRTTVSLYVIMLVTLAGIFLMSLEEKRVKKIYDGVGYAWRFVEKVITSERREDSQFRCHLSDSDVEYQKCRVSLLAFVKFHDEDVQACVDSKEESGAYTEHFRAFPVPIQSDGSDLSPQGQSRAAESSKTSCDIGERDASTWGQIWKDVRSAFREIRNAVWGDPSSFLTSDQKFEFKTYEHCVEGGSDDCKDLIEAIGAFNFNGKEWRIRILWVETNGWVQNLVGDGKEDEEERRFHYAVFLIVFVTATGMIAVMVYLIGRTARNFGRQAKRLQKQLEDQEALVIRDEGYGRELAGIATAAGARVAAARQIRERLMKCAVELGSGISHNENQVLSTLNLPEPILTAGEEGENASREHLEVVNKAIQGVRKSLDGISNQLIRASIGDFSGTGDFVNVGETLAERINAMNTLSKRDLVWRTDVPCLRSKTTQFAFFSIVHNLLSNAEKSARRTVKVSAKRNGGGVEVVVEDDGLGFPRSKRERDLLLVWGHRARLYVEQNAPGTGIGLALVAEWLRGSNGSIELSRSRELGGACVTVRVQCVEADS